jgi:hypothetical protein
MLESSLAVPPKKNTNSSNAGPEKTKDTPDLRQLANILRTSKPGAF